LYKAWVSFYASNEYKKRVDAIISSLDKVNVDFDEALEIFNRSVNYEIAFWDEALKQGI
jgi:thiaminase